jgi:hypothetical protein
MKSDVSTPAVVGVIVLVLLIAGFAFWHFSQGKAAPTNEQGIPVAPKEAKPGADAMSKLWKSREQPAQSR